MSTITPYSTPFVGPESGTPIALDQTQEPKTRPSFTPIWLVGSGASGKMAQMLGIRIPNASGDLAVILAQASLTLEHSIDESRKSSASLALAALAAALWHFDLAALERRVEVKRQAVDDTTATLNDVKDRMAPLVNARDQENARIAAYHQEISQIEAALANPDLSPAERAQLEAQLTEAQGGLAAALEARQAIDVELATLRIDSLDRQVADLEALLAAADPDSQEAAQIQTVLDTTRAKADAARTELANFIAGPKTEAALTAFSNSNLAALEGDVEALENRLAGYMAEQAEAKAGLENGTFLSTANTMRAFAQFFVSQSRRENQNAIRDRGIDRLFEELADQPIMLDRRLLFEVKEMDKREEVQLDDLAAERVQLRALALLGGLAELILTIARLAGEAEPERPAGPVTGSRLRLEI